MFRIRKAVGVAAATTGLLIGGAGMASADHDDEGGDDTSTDVDTNVEDVLDEVDLNVEDLLNDLDALNDVLDANVVTNDVLDIGVGDVTAGNVSVDNLGIVSLSGLLD